MSQTKNAAKEPTGILAIWNNCAPGHEAEYETWYQGEHLPERLGVPGFLRGRRYQALAADKQYFTCYETSSTAVLTSPAYLDRVNNPTEMTTRIMSGILTGISRTVCRQAAAVGSMRGGIAVTAKLGTGASGEQSQEQVRQLLATLGQRDGFARGQWWVSAEAGGTSQTAEEKLRGGDEKISACLMIELLRDDDADSVVDAITKEVGDTLLETGVYRLLCEMTADSIKR